MAFSFIILLNIIQYFDGFRVEYQFDESFYRLRVPFRIKPTDWVCRSVLQKYLTQQNNYFYTIIKFPFLSTRKIKERKKAKLFSILFQQFIHVLSFKQRVLSIFSDFFPLNCSSAKGFSLTIMAFLQKIFCALYKSNALPLP